MNLRSVQLDEIQQESSMIDNQIPNQLISINQLYFELIIKMNY